MSASVPRKTRIGATSRSLRGDLFVLQLELLDAQAAGVERGRRMIGDADVFEAALARGGEHLLHGVAPVGEGGVDVKRAAKVGDFDEAAVPFAFEVVAVLAALGIDVREAGFVEQLLLRAARGRAFRRAREMPRRIPACRW